MHTRLLLTLSALSLPFTSCEKVKKRSNEDLRPHVDSTEGNIRWFSLEDPACVTNYNASSAHSGTITTYQYDGTTVAARKASIQVGPGSDSAFASHNIIGTLINFREKYQCSYDSNKNRTCEYVKQNEKPSELKLCRSDMTYRRDSIESIALTSHAVVEDAYAFYSRIPNAKPDLPKSMMIVQPRIEREYTKSDGSKVTKFDRDNAAFTTIELGEKKKLYGLIVIMPTSVDTYAKEPVNLWEVPFVLKHEFGHHVFHHYIPNSGASADNFGNGNISDIFPNESSKIPHHGGLSLTAKSTAALGGIGETFADMFAYFAQEGAANQVKNIECLEMSRDPASATTRLGLVKQITAHDVDVYEGRATAQSRKNCDDPTFDDTHDIAIALGHPLAKFIETADPNKSGKERASHLTMWASEMQKIIETDQSTVNLDNLVLALIKSVKASASNSNFTAACAELRTKIPGLRNSTEGCQ